MISQLGPIMQNAYVPRDFDRALAFWTETVGVGPFFLMDHIDFQHLTYRGEPSDIDMSVAIGYWGDLQIELIKQHNGAASIYKTWIDEGQSGLHHVCLLTPDMARARQVCEAAGATMLQEGSLAGGGEFFYVDTGGGPGTMVEVVKQTPQTVDLFGMMKAAARDWDGSDALRRLG